MSVDACMDVSVLVNQLHAPLISGNGFSPNIWHLRAWFVLLVLPGPRAYSEHLPASIMPKLGSSSTALEALQGADLSGESGGRDAQHPLRTQVLRSSHAVIKWY